MELNNEPSPLSEYARFFPGVTPSCFQQDLVTDAIKDLKVWREVLIMWAGNDYRPQSIKKMIDCYAEKMAKKPLRFDPGRSLTPDISEPKCGRCLDIGEVGRLPDGAEFEWLVEYIPCPDCKAVIV